MRCPSATHRTLATTLIVLALSLSACGGGGGSASAPTSEPSPAPSSNPTPAAITPASLSSDPDMKTALALWRNDDLSKHPKGSCAGCHGADFFDLARIGSLDSELERRAKLDGATQAEADALVAAVRKMRTAYKLQTTNARTFRPFQPGEQVLLPDLTDPAHIQAVKRDIAFGKKLESLLPTLYGSRIDSLEKAKKARDELLDLARGSNTQGANAQRLNLRSLPVGIVYPLWSADLHHGAGEGTFNDWIADIAQDAKPEHKAQWLAVQDAYLADPSNQNFWKMYVAALSMTQAPQLGACTTENSGGCWEAPHFLKNKFLSALVGQHLLRKQALGQPDAARDALAFSYLDTDPQLAFFLTRPTGSGQSPGHLPGSMWEVGDFARTMTGIEPAPGSYRENLRKLGFPAFAQDSVDPLRSQSQEQHALRLAWFWIGFTFDPSLNRIHKSNSTKSAEYMVGTLLNERQFIHSALMTHMRLVAKGYLPEANKVHKTRPDRVEVQPHHFLMNYSYFVGYGRQILNWNETANNGQTFPQALKDEQAALWHRMVANGFRMSMYLQMEALDEEPLKSDTRQRAELQSWLQDRVEANGSVTRGMLYTFHSHFATYQPQHDAADDALLSAMALKAGVTVPLY